jgi:hypothetical protein
MTELLAKAHLAASQIVGDVASVRHVRTLPTGEEVFAAKCTERLRLELPRRVKITINPNGQKAAVEWKSGSSGENYKICDLGTCPAEEERI